MWYQPVSVTYDEQLGPFVIPYLRMVKGCDGRGYKGQCLGSLIHGDAVEHHGRPEGVSHQPNRRLSMSGQLRIRLRAAFTSSGSFSPLVKNPSLFPTPRKLNRKVPNPSRTRALQTSCTRPLSIFPPKRGWGWQTTTPGKGPVSPWGKAITPSKVRPLLLKATAVCLISSLYLHLRCRASV